MANDRPIPQLRGDHNLPGLIKVPVPGMEKYTIEFPPGTQPQEIADYIDGFRQSHRDEMSYAVGSTGSRLADSALHNLPEVLSTVGAGFGDYFGGPAGAGVGGGAGYAVGRLPQAAYEFANPPQIQWQAGQQPYSVTAKPQMPDPLTEGTNVFMSSSFPAAVAKLAPMVGPAFHNLMEKTGLAERFGLGHRFTRNYLAPDKSKVGTQERLDVDALMRKQGGTGLPISRYSDPKDMSATSEFMEAVASGGPFSNFRHQLGQGFDLLQEHGKRAANKGWSDSHIAGQNMLDLMEGSWQANIGRVQDLAYDAVRGKIPHNTRFVPADSILRDLQRPDNAMGSLVTEELRRVSASTPQAGGNLIALIENGSAKDVGGLTFDEAVKLRTILNKVGRKYAGSQDPTTAAMGLASINQASLLSEDIKVGVGKFSPRLRKGLEQADKQVSGIKDYFNDPFVLKFEAKVAQNPQTAMKELLQAGNAEDIYRLRAYLDPQGAKRGTNAMSPEWMKVQEWFKGELIRESSSTTSAGKIAAIDPVKLASLVNKYDEPTVRAIFDPGAWKDLKEISLGLSETSRTSTGPGKIAIQLATPQAVMGLAGAVGTVAGVGTYKASNDNPIKGAAAAALGAGTILLTPKAFGNILFNPSLRGYFRDGIWQYRQSGVIGPKLRAAIRQGEAEVAKEYTEDKVHQAAMPPTAPSMPSPTAPHSLSVPQP